MGTTTDTFDPYFVAAYNALNAHCGGGSTIGSGYRTIDEQRGLLYKRAQGISVADPGTSRHEGNHGGAIDLQFADDQSKACMHANAGAFGLDFGVPGEDWHLQFSDEGEAAALDGTFTDKYGVSADGTVAEQPAAAEPASPWENVRQRMMGNDTPNVAQSVAAWQSSKSAPATPEAAATDGSAFVPEASAGFDSGAQGTISATEAARYLAGAGFTGDALVTAVAVAMGESGLNTGAMGDTTITGGGWGPSVGLMQIRSRTSGDEANGWRDGSQLTDPAFNAKAAFAISNGGTNFGPWTVYTKGIYQKFVAEAKAAVTALGTDAYQPAAAPPAASAQPAADDPAAPMDAVFDPAGTASEIADMLLANQGEAGDIVKKITEADVSEDPSTTNSGIGLTL